MVKYIIVVITLLFFISNSYGQEVEDIIVRNAFEDFNTSDYSLIVGNRLGNPKKHSQKEFLLYPSYEPAKIYFLDSTIVDYKLNYNYENDNFVFENMDGELLRIINDKIDKIVFVDRRFYNRKYKKKQKSYNFEVIYEGPKLMLLKKNFVINKRETKNPLVPASEIIIKKEKSSKLFYILKNSNVAVKLPKRNRQFKKIFQNRYNEMVEYKRENDLSFKNEIDLILLFKMFLE